MKPTAFKLIISSCLYLGFSLFNASYADPVNIRVGHGSAAEEPLWVMKASPEATPDQGQKYTLDFTLFRGTDKRFQALEAGELDISTGSAHSVLMATSNGMQAKIIGAISREGGKEGFATQYMVKKDSPIQSVSDLKGKTVGINGARSSAEIWARLALAHHGLNPQRDVKWAAIPFPSQGEAVKAGKLDIGAFPQPFAAFENERGDLRTVFTSMEDNDDGEDLIFVLTTEKFANEQPEVLKSFMSDLVAATQYYADEPQKSRQELIDAKLVNIPLDTFVNMQSYRHPADAKVDMKALKKMNDQLIEFGYIEKGFDPEKIVDLSFLPE